MSITLPTTLKSLVNVQVRMYGDSTGSEDQRELIRRDQDRQRLRNLLLAGALSGPTLPVTETYFAGLRDRVSASTRASPSAPGRDEHGAH